MTTLAPRVVAAGLFVSSRPVSWINTAYPFAAAWLLSARTVDLTFIVGTLFFLIPYNLAMYGINDVFDYESDLRNPRKGGAQGAVLDRRLHRITLIAATTCCIPFVGYLLVVGSVASGAVLTAILFFVVFYSAPPLRLKEIPFADSITSSIHFFSPAVYGLVLAETTWTFPLVAVIVAFALWGIASHAFGAVQDVAADREAGISSVATFCGATRTVRLAITCYTAAGVAVLFTEWPGPLTAPLALLYIASAWPYRSISDDHAESATAGWRRFLWINQVAGAGVTLVLIGYALGR